LSPPGPFVKVVGFSATPFSWWVSVPHPIYFKLKTPLWTLFGQSLRRGTTTPGVFFPSPVTLLLFGWPVDPRVYVSHFFFFFSTILVPALPTVFDVSACSLFFPPRGHFSSCSPPPTANHCALFCCFFLYFFYAHSFVSLGFCFQ